MTRQLGWLAMLLVCLLSIAGCSSDKEKGVYKGKEKPVPADIKDNKG